MIMFHEKLNQILDSIKEKLNQLSTKKDKREIETGIALIQAEGERLKIYCKTHAAILQYFEKDTDWGGKFHNTGIYMANIW